MAEFVNPHCSVAKVLLRISGRQLDTDRISAELGVQPSGLKRLESPDEESDIWLLSAPVHRGGVDSYLRWIRQVIEPNLGFIKSLQHDASVRIYCGLNAHGGRCDVRFSPEELKMLVDLGIPLEVTVLF